MQTANNFRSDINGLRAWAVIAVVFYHFKFPGFAGGFVGVDVFFVISGFLMTGIISRALQQQSFSLWDFYRARALRIIPSLLLVCVATAAIGSFILLNSEYRALLKQTVYSLLFISNHYFDSAGDYFNNNSQQQPLLHTWSLAIEWQFYLLLPLALISAAKIGRDSTAQYRLLAVLSTLSLASLIYVQTNDGNGFYSLAARGWELLIGGLLYFANLDLTLKQVQKKWLCGGGFALLVIAINATPANNWPNLWAFLPIAATCSIIITAQQNNLLTSNRAAQLLGDISYPLYLWHWPLAVYLFLVVDSPTLLQKAITMLVALLLAAITHYTVEKYFLNKTNNRVLRFSLLILCFFTVISSVFTLHQKWDYSTRLTPEIEQIVQGGRDKHPLMRACSYRENSLQKTAMMPCTLQAGELTERPATAILLGDSHAAALAGELSKASPNDAIKIYAAYACPPIQGLGSSDNNYSCPKLLPQLIDEITQQQAGLPVIIYSRFNSYFGGINETSAPLNMDFSKLSVNAYSFTDAQYQTQLAQHLIDTLCTISTSNHVTVILPTPEIGFDPVTRIARDKLINRSKPAYGIELAQHRARSALALTALKQAQQQCGITLFDPIPYLCQHGFCAANDGANMRYFDDDHLSQYGASLFASELAKAFNHNNAKK